MRGGSPAAGTDHVWAAAAHISPLCKVAGPPMINSTGEQNKAAPRAFSPNSPITQCDAVCALAGIRPHATATCTQVADGPGLH